MSVPYPDDYALAPALPDTGCPVHVRGGRVRVAGCAEPPVPAELSDADLAQWPGLPLWFSAGELLDELRALPAAAMRAAGAYLEDVYRIGGATAVLCYMFGGGDLIKRVKKGTFVAGYQRTEVPAARVAEAKRHSCRKIVAYLKETLLRGCDAPATFVYVAVQPLGGAWRVEHLISVDPQRGVCLLEGTPLQRSPVDPQRYIALLESLLLPGEVAAGGAGRQEALAALFGARGVSVDASTCLACCAQAQDHLPEAMTRRWWNLLRWGNVEEAAFAATVARAARGASTTATLAEAERRGLLRSAAAPLDLPSKAAASNTAVLDHMYSGETFAIQSYERMRDDADRTGGYKRAIYATCGGKVVVEIGTGPFALLSLFAAEAGAAQVFAIEADPAAAKSAREYIARAGFSDVVTVLDGLSTHVALPGGVRADVVVHELIGVLTTEEGVVETLQDAAARLLAPTFLSIPHEVRTKAALYDVPLETDPMWKCKDSYGGWSLGTGLPTGPALAAPVDLECVTFTPTALRSASSTAERAVPMDVGAAGMARGVGVWVELRLLATDGDEDVVSSFKDTSCWPKMLVMFEKRAPVFPGCKFALAFRSERMHPMRYTFAMEGADVAPVVVQTGGAGWTGAGGTVDPLARSDAPRDALPRSLESWMGGEREGVLVEGRWPAMETRLTHIEGVAVAAPPGQALLKRLRSNPDPATRVTLRQCRLENTLSPLHLAVVRAEAHAAVRGAPARGWGLRDGLWGLSAAHMEVLASGGRVGAARSAVKDTSFHGTPEEWRRVLRTQRDAAPAGGRDIGLVYVKDDGARETLTRDTYLATFGREYLDCDVVGYDFILSAMLRCRITFPNEHNEDGAEAYDDRGHLIITEAGPVLAARAFPAGAFVCRLHGETEPAQALAGDPGQPPDAAHRQHYPTPDLPFYLNTAWRCSPGCFIRPAAQPNCERSLRPHRGMLCLVVYTLRAVAQGEELTLVY